MFGRNKKAEKGGEYLFDFKKQSRIPERILEKYILRGKIKNYNSSFLIISNKDSNGNVLSCNIGLENFAYIIEQQKWGERHSGLRLNNFPNYSDDLFSKTQWFARINYDEPISIVANEYKTLYELRMPHQEKLSKKDGEITHITHNDYNPFWGGAFQSDKILQDPVLITDVGSKRLDEMINDIYSDNIREIYK